MMINSSLEQAVKVWPLVSDIVFVPHTEEEYERTVALLDELIDEVGENEEHPLASLMETVGTLVETYETEHFRVGGLTYWLARPATRRSRAVGMSVRPVLTATSISSRWA